MVCPTEQRVPMAVNKNKIFLSWANYRYYFVWGFPDHSARIATVDNDRVRGRGWVVVGWRVGSGVEHSPLILISVCVCVCVGDSCV